MSAFDPFLTLRGERPLSTHTCHLGPAHCGEHGRRAEGYLFSSARSAALTGSGR